MGRKENRAAARDAYRQVAANHNITPREVRREITTALKSGRASTAPAAQSAWNTLRQKTDVRNTESVLCTLACEIQAEQTAAPAQQKSRKP